MRHRIHLVVDEVGEALAATARLLTKSPFAIEELSVSADGVRGRARLTALVEAPPNARVAELFQHAIAPPIASIPYHWQADGAGDDRAG